MVEEAEETLIIYLSYMLLILSAPTLILLSLLTAPYGRYSRLGWGLLVPSKVAWVVQELPSFIIPMLLVFYVESPNNLKRFAVSLFIFHYVQRSLIFPFLIRGGKPTPLITFLMAIAFCSLNGYMQASYILKYASFVPAPLTYLRLIAGTAVFFSGMVINIHSDSILRNLRKPGESGYKIPRGGMFTYVSGANFVGEIIEWWGFALLNWTLPALSFAVFTICNIGPRALQHHRWYKEKFHDYPKDRKALIPFIL